MLNLGLEEPAVDNECLLEVGPAEDSPILRTDRSAGRPVNRYCLVVAGPGGQELLDRAAQSAFAAIGSPCIALDAWRKRLPDRSKAASLIRLRQAEKAGWAVADRDDHHVAARAVAKETAVIDLLDRRNSPGEPGPGRILVFSGLDSPAAIEAMPRSVTSLMARSDFCPDAAMVARVGRSLDGFAYPRRHTAEFPGLVVVSRAKLPLAAAFGETGGVTIFAGADAHKAFLSLAVPFPEPAAPKS